MCIKAIRFREARASQTAFPSKELGNERIQLYNPFDYLQSDEEITEYLTQALMDDDPRVLGIALGYLAKARGIADLAEKTGLNRESLYKTLSGKTQPKWSTINRIIKALNIRIQAVT
ncbi:addiction module antidote protein [Methylotuvimicrobium alcaliphilum]|uniref:addiction module antidote protein n=1 Tax=Methylotuvimicrobium alcaliphilum TaxID=271065 RepID=UPI001CC26AC2|nr:addiction module antidote protein [Methylotuvimicrobium alcaliphilum]